MSAYVVNKRHIDALVTAAVESAPIGAYFGRERVDYSNADAVGAALWRANVESVAFRYPNDAEGEWPGPVGLTRAEVDAYTFEPLLVPLSPVELLVALRGYEYQSCERPDWRDSDAYTFCRGLESLMLRRLPGWDDADWSISDDRAVRPLYRGVRV